MNGHSDVRVSARLVVASESQTRENDRQSNTNPLNISSETRARWAIFKALAGVSNENRDTVEAQVTTKPEIVLLSKLKAEMRLGGNSAQPPSHKSGVLTSLRPAGDKRPDRDQITGKSSATPASQVHKVKPKDESLSQQQPTPRSQVIAGSPYGSLPSSSSGMSVLPLFSIADDRSLHSLGDIPSPMSPSQQKQATPLTGALDLNEQRIRNKGLTQSIASTMP